MAIAVGATWLGARLLRRIVRRSPRVEAAAVDAMPIDYRLVALGALMPDAVDKPLWRIFRGDIGSDHTIGHTLLVSLAILTAGALLAQRGEKRLLWLGFGWLTHPLVDPVIAYPATLFWPAFGFQFKPSPGIPSVPYLVGLDVMLVVVAAIALMRNGWLRNGPGRSWRGGGWLERACRRLAPVKARRPASASRPP